MAIFGCVKFRLSCFTSSVSRRSSELPIRRWRSSCVRNGHHRCVSCPMSQEGLYSSRQGCGDRQVFGVVSTRDLFLGPYMSYFTLYHCLPLHVGCATVRETLCHNTSCCVAPIVFMSHRTPHVVHSLLRHCFGSVLPCNHTSKKRIVPMMCRGLSPTSDRRVAGQHCQRAARGCQFPGPSFHTKSQQQLRRWWVRRHSQHWTDLGLWQSRCGRFQLHQQRRGL